MLRGICVNQGSSIILNEGHTYFLFPNGESHYYVSKFPNSKAHMGCFHISMFELLEVDEKAEKKIELEERQHKILLDKDKVYRATLIHTREGYKSLKFQEFYLTPKNTHAYFYDDPSLNTLRGCFPISWFSDFREVSYNIEETSLETLLAIPNEPSNMESQPQNIDENTEDDFVQLTLF